MIGPDGTIAPGLNTTGAVNGSCRDAVDLDNTNGYARSLCNNGWCAVMYGLYFEKDQAVAGSGLGGHRHDWEHVVVWIQNNEARYVSTSAHGDFDIYTRDQIRWDGTHPKVVYHKDGIGTHCFRPANSNDEPPENHYHDWRFPTLVGWNGYPMRPAGQAGAGELRQRGLRPQGRQFQQPSEKGAPRRNSLRSQRLTPRGRAAPRNSVRPAARGVPPLS